MGLGPLGTWCLRALKLCWCHANANANGVGDPNWSWNVLVALPNFLLLLVPMQPQLQPCGSAGVGVGSSMAMSMCGQWHGRGASSPKLKLLLTSKTKSTNKRNRPLGRRAAAMGIPFFPVSKPTRPLNPYPTYNNILIMPCLKKINEAILTMREMEKWKRKCMQDARVGLTALAIQGKWETARILLFHVLHTNSNVMWWPLTTAHYVCALSILFPYFNHTHKQPLKHAGVLPGALNIFGRNIFLKNN